VRQNGVNLENWPATESVMGAANFQQKINLSWYLLSVGSYYHGSRKSCRH